MLRERYAPYSLFDAVPRLALRFEPELAEVDRLLDDEPLFRLVRDDLARRYPRTTETGRSTTSTGVDSRPVPVVRRAAPARPAAAAWGPGRPGGWPAPSARRPPARSRAGSRGPAGRRRGGRCTGGWSRSRGPAWPRPPRSAAS